MKPIMLLAALPLLGALACKDSNATTNPSSTAPAADNTKVNERDKNATLTPMDQKNNDADLTLTQKIRQDVVKADGLSMDAKNVKIITVNGVVTLRGPVKSEDEKTTVANLAKAEAGVKSVDNQLEVAK